MKSKRLADYVALIKATSDNENYIKAKRLGESVIKKLHKFRGSPLDNYFLYFELGHAYTNLSECAHSIDAFYKASAIALKHHLGPAYVAHTALLIGNSLILTKNIDQALSQYQKVETYYEKYGEETRPMTKLVHMANLISSAYCALYKNDLGKAEEILERKLSSYQPILSKNSLARLDYNHFKGEYLTARKEYNRARQAFQECINIGQDLNFPTGKLEAQIHLAIIHLLENQLEEAINILLVIFKDAQHLKLGSLACESALLLSRCYVLKKMPHKAELMERRVKPILKTLDVVWFHEKRREFERLYNQLQPSNQTSPSVVKFMPTVITQRLNQHYEASRYKDLIIGMSTPMQEVYQLIEKIAPTDLPALIQGETGTGKELVAYAIHSQSRRCGKPYLAINCSAIPETLLESALFGHTRGAFTSAHQDKKGYLELASSGTLFIDEVATMPLTMQPKLLRVLEDKQVWRIGAQNSIKVDTRFIFASNQEIKELVRRKLFREDLFYRLTTLVINLPPLRERKEDIPQLVEHFLAKYNPAGKVPAVSRTAMDMLVNYRWPGNVRELENEIQRICILNKDAKEIDELCLSECVYSYFVTDLNRQDGLSLKQLRDSCEREAIVKALEKFKGNLSHTASHLRCTRPYLYRRIRQFKITNTY